MNKYISYIKTKASEDRMIILLIFIYFLFRLINLTKLPIFNDEAIYLDWGWRETHIPGMLFYSLYDSKQPLLMWLFGISESIFNDQLLAGRLVSVIAGFFTFLGIYYIGKNYFDKKTALLSSFLYIIIPIFSFFDRQALMESSVSVVGILSLCVFLKIIKKLSKKYFIFLGMVLGIGFLIKTSSIIFFISFLVLSIIYAFSKNYKAKILLKYIPLTLTTILTVDLILLIQPLFWETLPTNSRYSLTLGELIKFPINNWINNFLGNLEISFIYLTPVIFISGIFGSAYILVKKRDKFNIACVLWLLVCLMLQFLTVRGTSTRYLVSYLPIVVIPSAFFISSIYDKLGRKSIILIFLFFVIPISATMLQIFSPVDYFNLLSKLTRFSDMGYINTQTSGYGIEEINSFLNKSAENRIIIASFALNAGNPENAIIVYNHKSGNIATTYFDSQLFRGKLDGIDCLSSKIPLYFISRFDQQVGLDRFLYEVKKVKNPYSDYYMTIYRLKTNCTGKTFILN